MLGLDALWTASQPGLRLQGWLAVPQDWLDGPEGGRDGQTDGKSPHCTGHHPLLGPLPWLPP